MRVLLLHPEDPPFDPRWSDSHWDLIVDLGWAGQSQYAEWRERFRCQVRGLYSFANWHDDVRRLHQVFSIGNGTLVDSEGIDWWALLTPRSYQGFYEFFLLQKVAGEIRPTPELYATRAHPMADVLGKLLGTEAKLLCTNPPASFASRLRRYGAAFNTFTPKQIAMIAGDKWDADYRLRRFFARKPKSTAGAKILLPTAYRNVSRTVVSYARLLSDTNFLLVTTRADGLLDDLPPHIQPARLAAYAPTRRNKSTEQEIASLTTQWRLLESNLLRAGDPAHRQIALLLEDLSRGLRNGLRIRDAWRRVFEEESISAVLCGDENNAYIRLPVLLAKKRGVWTVHSSHGALDTAIMLNGVCSDLYLVRGEMEADYLVQGGLPRDRILIGSAPLEPRRKAQTAGPDIFFFSEPYELFSGRTELFYRELLVNLCQIARAQRRKVIVKLHPFENAPARSALVDRALSTADRELVEISIEPMSEKLLQRIWFAVTVESSVAVECAVVGVPCFLCAWFDLELHSYGKQYEKFGAAQRLGAPQDVLQIPEMLAARTRLETTERFYDPISPEALAVAFRRGDFVQA